MAQVRHLSSSGAPAADPVALGPHPRADERLRLLALRQAQRLPRPQRNLAETLGPAQYPTVRRGGRGDPALPADSRRLAAAGEPGTAADLRLHRDPADPGGDPRALREDRPPSALAARQPVDADGQGHPPQRPLPGLGTRVEIKDRSKRSFPGDHASVLLVWALFMSLFARRAGQFLLIWTLAVLFMMPRLVAGAHWGQDDYIGGLQMALLALAWGCYTPLAAKASGWLVQVTEPLFRLLAKLPLIGRLGVVRDSA
ncbi:phosphatase PAP2 family protein [Pseudomonas aeruginosa]|nr:phosphatase PAP2 family protein [Pseudomonas aeruginosa]